ncbi:MAG TPA: hypothetical protein PLN42_10915, partial [Anaerolineae bacterium]|nr:hypothetical protein [Anaerolineae bacterium]
MNRTQRILIALLVFQVILSIVLLRPGKISGGGEVLLAGVAADNVTSLIVDGRESGRVELHRVNGVWSL